MARILIIGLLSSIFGLALGYSAGNLVLLIGAHFGVAGRGLFLSSVIVIGCITVWYFLPLENKYYWNKVVNREITADNAVMEIRSMYKFAPISFFFILGLVFGLDPI